MANDPAMRELADLPVLDELADPSWGADIGRSARALFGRGERGPMRSPWGDLVVYTVQDLGTLRQHPSAVHQSGESAFGGLSDTEQPPVDFLRLVRESIFFMRGARHGAEKPVVARTLAPRSVAQLRPDFGAAIRSALREAVGSGPVDFRKDVVEPAVGAFWAQGLGMSERETALAFEYAEALAPALAFLDPTPAQIDASNDGARDFDALMMRVLRRSGEAGGFPLVDGLLEVHAQGGGPDALADPYTRLTTSMFDAFSSLPSLLTSLAFVAAEREVDLTAGGADPQRFASSFFLEATRLHAAVTLTVREAASDFELGDVKIPEGTNILMLWLLGNRDPQFFADPDEFRLDRENRARQYSFGGGPWVCPGRNVAQALGEVMVTEMIQESITLDLRGAPTWVPGSALHDLDDLQVHLTAGAVS